VVVVVVVYGTTDHYQALTSCPYILIRVVFYGERLSAAHPAYNLEEASVFMTPGDRMTQIYS
jgi:vancomycin permeability regulator SanA